MSKPSLLLPAPASRREIVVTATPTAWERDRNGDGYASEFDYSVLCGCGAPMVYIDDHDAHQCEECEADWREVCSDAAADCGESINGQASAEWKGVRS